MKYKITPLQLSKISEEALTALVNRFYPPMHMLAQINKGKVLEQKNQKIEITTAKGSYIYFTNTATFYPLLNIYQMIDFLGDLWLKKLRTTNDLQNDVTPSNDTLCDLLWNTVVKELDKQIKSSII